MHVFRRLTFFGMLQNEGLAIKEEGYKTRVPRSQRGGEVIEPLVRDQWFVRMQPLAEPALKASIHIFFIFAASYH